MTGRRRCLPLTGRSACGHFAPGSPGQSCPCAVGAPQKGAALSSDQQEEELNAKLTRRVQKAARRQAKQEELKRLHRAQGTRMGGLGNTFLSTQLRPATLSAVQSKAEVDRPPAIRVTFG
ncbi:hypothetical protein P7K49_003125 [Saguinus oedipus]|uniref:Uncharacterized protein n=1 Tax=Saguinus oedipus TaxID=9490 RepID=A0ABQ9WJA8_SAGOE|nr:hypothetical protein P7K49_003125 [Saguinus oedipus]